jgi:hypothetical protein
MQVNWRDLFRYLTPLEEQGTRTRNDGQNPGGGFFPYIKLEDLATISDFLGILFVHPTTLKVLMNRSDPQ